MLEFYELRHSQTIFGWRDVEHMAADCGSPRTEGVRRLGGWGGERSSKLRHIFK